MKFKHKGWNGKVTEQSLDDMLNEVPEGWHDVLKQGFKKMFNLGWDGSYRQIKEKFGSLRLYADCSSEAHDIIDDMTKKTGQICCKCGEPKTKMSQGWVMFYCDEHFPQN